MLSAFRVEVACVEALKQLGLSNADAVQLLMQSSARSEGQQETESQETFDTREEWEKPGKKKQKAGPSPIFWWNDLTKDKRYKSWPKSLEAILSPQFQMSLPTVRHNLFNVLVVANLTSATALKTVADNLQLARNGVPVRFGIVPMAVRGDIENAKMVRAFLFLMVDYGRKAASDFIAALAESQLDGAAALASACMKCVLAEDIGGS